MGDVMTSQINFLQTVYGSACMLNLDRMNPFVFLTFAAPLFLSHSVATSPTTKPSPDYTLCRGSQTQRTPFIWAPVGAFIRDPLVQVWMEQYLV